MIGWGTFPKDSRTTLVVLIFIGGPTFLRMRIHIFFGHHIVIWVHILSAVVYHIAIWVRILIFMGCHIDIRVHTNETAVTTEPIFLHRLSNFALHGSFEKF